MFWRVNSLWIFYTNRLLNYLKQLQVLYKYKEIVDTLIPFLCFPPNYILTAFCSCTGLLYWMGSVLFDVQWVEDSKGK